MMNFYDKQRTIIFDESGNLGSFGRYFVIACVDTENYKSLHNIMHKKLGIAKRKFPELANLHANEIKAKDAYPCIKYHILQCIASKDLTISHIVADLSHTEPHLLAEKNIFYNYLMKLLLDSIISEADNGKTINIICDNKTTKVASANCLEEYLKLHFIYDRGLHIRLNIEKVDSDSKFAYPVQAADYVANALYGMYEYNDDIYYNTFKTAINQTLKFPRQYFGK